MKKKYFAIFFLIVLVCIPVFCEELEHQIIEFIGGIFPNSDMTTNTYLETSINYNSFFKSTLIVDIKDHSSSEKDTTEDDDEIYINKINKKTLIDLKVIEWAIPVINNKSFKIKITPGIKVDYIHIDESYQSQEIWEDDAGMNQMYMETDEIKTDAIMPMLTTLIDLRFSEYVDFIFGVDILPYGFDWTVLSEYDATTDPTIDDAFYQQDFDSFFTSFGIGLNISLEVYNTGFGGIRLDVAGLYKIGTSTNYGKYWDENELEFNTEYWDSEEQRISLRSNLFYSLDFLKIRDIIPVLKVGYELAYVYQDEELEEDSSYDQFDFGVAFKY